MLFSYITIFRSVYFSFWKSVAQPHTINVPLLMCVGFTDRSDFSIISTASRSQQHCQHICSHKKHHIHLRYWNYFWILPWHTWIWREIKLGFFRAMLTHIAREPRGVWQYFLHMMTILMTMPRWHVMRSAAGELTSRAWWAFNVVYGESFEVRVIRGPA